MDREDVMSTEGLTTTLTTTQWEKVKTRMREYSLTIQGHEFLDTTIRDPESHYFGHGLGPVLLDGAIGPTLHGDTVRMG